MSVHQLINVRADDRADKALASAIAENILIESIFPAKSIVIQIAGARVSGSPKEAISELWGEQVARDLFSRRVIVSSDLFSLIYWEGMAQVMKR